jgi:hypothetical protein
VAVVEPELMVAEAALEEHMAVEEEGVVLAIILLAQVPYFLVTCLVLLERAEVTEVEMPQEE